MNETETRAEHVDPALKTAGWGMVEGSRIRRVSKYPRPHRGTWQAGQGADGRLCDEILQYQAGRVKEVPAAPSLYGGIVAISLQKYMTPI